MRSPGRTGRQSTEHIERFDRLPQIFDLDMDAHSFQVGVSRMAGNAWSIWHYIPLKLALMSTVGKFVVFGDNVHGDGDNQWNGDVLSRIPITPPSPTLPVRVEASRGAADIRDVVADVSSEDSSAESTD